MPSHSTFKNAGKHVVLDLFDIELLCHRTLWFVSHDVEVCVTSHEWADYKRTGWVCRCYQMKSYK